MNKIERGQRNLAKLRTIANPYIGRGRVTFWNPTPDQQTTTTVHSTDANAVLQLHDAMAPGMQARWVEYIATLYGFHKLLALAWSRATLTSTVYVYDANGLRKVGA